MRDGIGPTCGQFEQLGGQRLDLALGGCGIDQGGVLGQGHFVLHRHGWVADCAVKWGCGGVVFLGHLGAMACAVASTTALRTASVNPITWAYARMPDESTRQRFLSVLRTSVRV